MADAREIDLMALPIAFSTGLWMVTVDPFSANTFAVAIQSAVGGCLLIGSVVWLLVLRAKATGEVDPAEQERRLYECLSGACEEGEHIALALHGSLAGGSARENRALAEALGSWAKGVMVVLITFIPDRDVLRPYMKEVFPDVVGEETPAYLIPRVERALTALRSTRDRIEQRQIKTHTRVREWNHYSKLKGKIPL